MSQIEVGLPGLCSATWVINENSAECAFYLLSQSDLNASTCIALPSLREAFQVVVSFVACGDCQ